MRSAALVAGTWIVGRWWPAALGLGPTDPLASTVALLPALVVAIIVADRIAVAGGARALRWGSATSDVIVAIAWTAAAAARPRLGLDHLAPVLAAALFVLVGLRIAQAVVCWRPLLGSHLPSRPHGLFFVLPLLAYLTILPWSTSQRPPDGDEPYVLLLTHSLAHDLDVDLANQYSEQPLAEEVGRELEPQPGDPVGSGGEILSRHTATLPLLLAPAYRIGGVAGAQLTMALLAALLSWWFLRAARHVPVRPGAAYVAWAVFAFCPPVLLYATQIWVEIPAALLVMVGLDLLASGTPFGWAMLPLLALPALKLRFATLAVAVGIWGWFRRGRRGREAIVGGALAVAAIGLVLVTNQLQIGNPLRMHSGGDLAPADLTAVGLGLLGLFFDVAFGLFAVAPVWALLLAGPPRRHLRTAAGLGVVALPYLLTISTRPEWYGGWSPPFRYGLAVLPIVGLAIALVLDGRSTTRGRSVRAALAAATVGLGVAWLAEPGWTYDLAHGSQHLLDQVATRLRLDVIAWLPSMVRPRTATWLWPLAIGLAIPLAWRVRTTGRIGPAAGVALALAFPAVLVAGASLRPTTTAEAEDPWIAKTDGALYPARWTIARHRFRGGWFLPQGEQLTIPIVPGGSEARIVVHLAFQPSTRRPATIRLGTGDRELRVWRPGPSDAEAWREVRTGWVPWQRGDDLVLSIDAIAEGRRRNAFVVDRVELEWR